MHVCDFVRAVMCGYVYAKQWRSTVCKRETVCVCVVLPSLPQCRRPTIIKAASHTELALHYSYSSLQKCGDGKHLNKWIQVSILKMET